MFFKMGFGRIKKAGNYYVVSCWAKRTPWTTLSKNSKESEIYPIWLGHLARGRGQEWSTEQVTQVRVAWEPL